KWMDNEVRDCTPVFMAFSSESSSEAQPRLRGGLSSARILVAEDPFVNTFLRTVLKRHGDTVTVGEPHHSACLLHDGSLQADLVITNRPAEFLEFRESIAILYTASNPDPAAT